MIVGVSILANVFGYDGPDNYRIRAEFRASGNVSAPDLVVVLPHGDRSAVVSLPPAQ